MKLLDVMCRVQPKDNLKSCAYFHPTRPDVKTLHVQRKNVKNLNQDEKIRLDFDDLPLTFMPMKGDIIFSLDLVEQVLPQTHEH